MTEDMSWQLSPLLPTTYRHLICCCSAFPNSTLSQLYSQLLILLLGFQIVEMDSSDIFQDTGADRVDEYEEELTAAEVLQKLEDYWLNEKQSPELLEPKMEIVECMLEQVKHHHHDMISVKHGLCPFAFLLLRFRLM